MRTLQLEMGGPNAIYPVSVGVEGVLKVISSLKPEDSGQFFNFRGERVPWCFRGPSQTNELRLLCPVRPFNEVDASCNLGSFVAPS